jgi:hypothetical protein
MQLDIGATHLALQCQTAHSSADMQGPNGADQENWATVSAAGVIPDASVRHPLLDEQTPNNPK